MMLSLTTLTTLTLLSLRALAHEGTTGHDQIPIPADADWATRHMAEEHHISNYDAGSFFNLHDYSSSGSWSADDILRTYGLKDPSTSHVPKESRDTVVDTILNLFDKDRSGTVSFAEFTVGDAHGIKLPDFGYGPGHHGDDEYEYEIHHFEKFHGPDTKEEDLIHPEDIAHFKHHEELELEEEKREMMDRLAVVPGNIPGKFRRRG